MKALVIYDSVYGNTEKIAKAVANGLECDAIPISAVSPSVLSGVSLLVVGSPTHGGTPSPVMQKFIANWAILRCLQRRTVGNISTEWRYPASPQRPIAAAIALGAG